MINRSTWTRQEIERHSLDMRQFADFRQAVLPDGQRIVEAYNSSGLRFTLLPDCGLDIWAASYNGLPLTWLSQGSPHRPDFGQTWLQHFNGGLMVTCGLTHAGPPETDPETGEFRDLHGRYTRLSARGLSASAAWEDDTHYRLSLRAAVSESAMFGDQLRLDRTYRLTLGEPRIELQDTVTNLNDRAVPLMILYHFNFGFPLIREGTRLATPARAVYPRDKAALAGIDHRERYDAATPGYAEQVFFHHLNHDGDGETEAVLHQDDWGVSLRWDAGALPYLTQWKNTRQGMYVCGVEPGNCIPEGRNAAQESGRLQMLDPGASMTFSIRLTVLDGPEAVQERLARVDRLRQTGTAAANCHLEDYR